MERRMSCIGRHQINSAWIAGRMHGISMETVAVRGHCFIHLLVTLNLEKHTIPVMKRLNDQTMNVGPSGHIILRQDTGDARNGQRYTINLDMRAISIFVR
jgi:hypothetical protein